MEVLARLAKETGLDEAEFSTAAKTGKYRQAHLDALKSPYEGVNVSAVPTFIIGNKKVRGLLREDDLRRLIEQELNASDE